MYECRQFFHLALRLESGRSMENMSRHMRQLHTKMTYIWIMDLEGWVRALWIMHAHTWAHNFPICRNLVLKFLHLADSKGSQLGATAQHPFGLRMMGIQDSRSWRMERANTQKPTVHHIFENENSSDLWAQTTESFHAKWICILANQKFWQDKSDY